MKFKKIVLPIMLILVFLFTNVSNAANNSENMTISEKKINEYQIFKELKSKTDEDLKDMGLSKEEIKEIRETDPIKTIKELNKLEDNFLKGKGYTDEQIKIIRNFKGTEEEVMALGATLTYTFTPYNWGTVPKCSTYPNGYSFLMATVNWSWSSEPIFTTNDIMAFCWSDGFYTASDMTYLDVKYYRNDTGAWDENRRIEESVQPGAGCSFKFPLQGRRISSDGTTHTWAKSGYSLLRIYRNDIKSGVEIISKYGHTVLNLSPGVQYGTIPLTISFSWGVQEEAYTHNVIDLTHPKP